jgi:hypothetical protein
MSGEKVTTARNRCAVGLTGTMQFEHAANSINGRSHNWRHGGSRVSLGDKS